ncbi:DUF4280 domain-containing protein [Listeria booriae]|uniref:DUF4280 domain-containing protein n=1 Tax=Listeria booriae TaxID=1552123 RepID=UPI00164EB3DE|nr:DUF4280 domain-containing protein [Listeria booriae]MBC6301296.1 DUF4280 domain-containing protein [Listeria booriae]
MSEESQSYVVAGALLKCDKAEGSQGCYLNLKASHGVYTTDGLAQCHVGDRKVPENISTFGTCSVDGKKCVPVLPLDWLEGKQDALIDGKPGLISGCHLQCMRGEGKIVVAEDGQGEVGTEENLEDLPWYERIRVEAKNAIDDLEFEDFVEMGGMLLMRGRGKWKVPKKKVSQNKKSKKSRAIKDVTDFKDKTREEIPDSLPEGWTHTEHNGRIHIKDENGIVRVRTDPPDKQTNYNHMHIYDKDGKPLDKYGNLVDRKSTDAHIPWDGK